MKIFNGTPHDIVVYKIEDVVYLKTIRKWVLNNPKAEPIAQIKSSGKVLSAKIETVQSGYTIGIPTFEKRIEGYDPLPEGYDIYIVSMLYASAALKKGEDKIFTIADPVYTEDGKTILGCLGICPAF